MEKDHIDWKRTSKETCIEIIAGLREELHRLHVQYDERAAAMRETGDQVRSLYQGSQVSRRIIFLQGKIEGARHALWSGNPEAALKILETEVPS